MQKRSVALALVIASILMLSACATRPAAPPTPIEKKAVRLEKRALVDMQVQDYTAATASAHDALRLYALLDDQFGQLRSHINLTRLFILRNQRDKAERHLAKANALVVETDAVEQRYQIHLLAGKLYSDSAEFEQASAHANSSLERAVADTYLHRYRQAYDGVKNMQVTSATEQDDMAFVLLQYARFADDATAANNALILFKKNENTIGISDSLYVLAMLTRKQGNQARAAQYLRRALEVNLAMGDKQRIAATLEALEEK